MLYGKKGKLFFENWGSTVELGKDLLSNEFPLCYTQTKHRKIKHNKLI